MLDLFIETLFKRLHQNVNYRIVSRSVIIKIKRKVKIFV